MIGFIVTQVGAVLLGIFCGLVLPDHWPQWKRMSLSVVLLLGIEAITWGFPHA